MKILTLILATMLVGALALGCSTPASPEAKLKHDLLGHTTGSGESAWLFRGGQIKQLTIVSEYEDTAVVNMILRSAETAETFFVIVQVKYIHGFDRIESVGLLFIQKLNQ